MTSPPADLAGAQVISLLRGADHLMLGYWLVVNTSYLLLILLAILAIGRQLRRTPYAGHDDAYASALTPPISMVVPAYNEQAGVVEAVQALLLLRYPQFEVIVINDGSTDQTLGKLVEAFDLVEVERVVPDDVPTLGTLHSIHVPRSSSDPLVVISKENGKGKADALNVGINAARYPLVCLVDADSLLDAEALLWIAKPFTEDPLRVIAAGGVIDIVNGCSVDAGRVVEVAMPRRLLPRIQVVEYLRAFLFGRTGWSRLGGLLIISGAFGLFRRDVLVEVGGLDPHCQGEDAELVVRLHRHMRERGREYRIVFVPEPVCWSEAPSTARVLAGQRRRWHRGICEVLYRHRRMIGNPKYGRIGLLSVPYYLLFELIAPVVELAGLVLVPLGVLAGAVDLAFLWRFLLASYGLALVSSLTAITAQEYAFHRFSRWQDVGVLLAAAVAELLGYRQLTAWWQLKGLWAALRNTEPVWGAMPREGFANPKEAAESDSR